jgi:hypothetical protein
LWGSSSLRRVIECAGIRESTSANQANGSMPHRLQEATKLRNTAAVLPPASLPKSPSGAAVRYTLNQWEALTRFLEDGELEIDNGATERANRDIALGRGNWTFFGSDAGGKTAALLRSFIASCKRCGVEPFAWFHDVLSRIPAHSITRLSELLPQNWKPITCPAQV